MHIVEFLSNIFIDNKGKKQQQQQDTSTSQADDIDILAIEGMEHVDALNFDHTEIN